MIVHFQSDPLMDLTLNHSLYYYKFLFLFYISHVIEIFWQYLLAFYQNQVSQMHYCQILSLSEAVPIHLYLS